MKKTEGGKSNTCGNAKEKAGASRFDEKCMGVISDVQIRGERWKELTPKRYPSTAAECLLVPGAKT